MENKLGFVLLFVENPLRSCTFYQKLFNMTPIETSPTFAMFALENGTMLGLWNKHTAEPDIVAQPGAAEICFASHDVDMTYEEIGMSGVDILQKPTDMDFGHTFVFKDNDGHRIRIYKLHERPDGEHNQQ